MFIRAAEHSTLLFGIFGDYRMFSMVLKISELFNTIMNNNSSIKKDPEVFCLVIMRKKA